MKKAFLPPLAVTMFFSAAFAFAAGSPFETGGIERVAAAGTVLAVPAPKGLHLTREQPSPGESAKIALRTGMGGLRMTVAFADAASSRPDGGERGGGAMDGDLAAALVDDYARKGVRATVRRRSSLDFGGGDMSAAYVGLSARKECKPYTLGTAEGVATVSGVSVPFTIRLFQGDPESDETLVAGWLEAFYALNADAAE